MSVEPVRELDATLMRTRPQNTDPFVTFFWNAPCWAGWEIRHDIA